MPPPPTRRQVPDGQPPEGITRRVDPDEALVRRHQRAVWRYLRFLGAPAGLADDLTQDAFLALLRHPPVDRGEAATAGWLRTVARRLFHASRTPLRRGLEFADTRTIERAWLEGEGAPTTGDDPYREALERCMDDLAPRARRAIDLRYGEDTSREEMARALDLSTDGVKTLLRRTREALQRCVETNLRRMA